jgi:hypothetical protein
MKRASKRGRKESKITSIFFPHIQTVVDLLLLPLTSISFSYNRSFIFIVQFSGKIIFILLSNQKLKISHNFYSMFKAFSEIISIEFLRYGIRC